MPMRVRGALLAAIIAGALVPLGHAQQREVAFEVVSIKPSAPPTPLAPGTRAGWLPGGLYIVRQTNMINLFGIAYRPAGPGSLGSDHIDVSHVSSWVTSQRFDIEARASGAPDGWGTDEVDQPYLRALLRDRFKLDTHFETRDLPVYWMTVAKSDGSLGPTMKRNTQYDCDEITRLRREDPSKLPPPNQTHPICTVMAGRDIFAGGSVSLTLLAQALRGTVGAPIVDHTGLTGYFDIDVHYTPDRMISGTDASIPEWPTLITAIQDQLGLKLEQHREPQQVLVIDHIERPSED